MKKLTQVINESKSINKAEKLRKIISHTNARLGDWYRNAKKDHGVVGKAVCYHDPKLDAIKIDTIEDGKKMSFTNEFWEDQAIEYSYNIWMENPEYGS